MVHSIMRHVAEKTQHPIEDLYERIGWPLNKKYGHAVDAFKLSITYDYHYIRLEKFTDLHVEIPTCGKKLHFRTMLLLKS